MKLRGFLLLQALFAFLTLSFMMSAILLSSHYLGHNYLHTQASLQLEHYKHSAFMLIVEALSQGELIATHRPATYDISNAALPALFQPYHLSFNLLKLPVEDFACVEVYLSITLPDGTLLQHYDSALLYKNLLHTPKLPCKISLMPHN